MSSCTARDLVRAFQGENACTLVTARACAYIARVSVHTASTRSARVSVHTARVCTLHVWVRTAMRVSTIHMIEHALTHVCAVCNASRVSMRTARVSMRTARVNVHTNNSYRLHEVQEGSHGSDEDTDGSKGSSAVTPASFAFNAGPCSLLSCSAAFATSIQIYCVTIRCSGCRFRSVAVLSSAAGRLFVASRDGFDVPRAVG